MKNKYLIYILFLSQHTIAQQSDSIINTKFISSNVLDANEFIGVDEFKNLYYLKNNTFYKKNNNETLSYTNTQLGKVTSVDIKNPLKIILFYRDFNSVILLDNKLNELSSRIDFKETFFSKNISLLTGTSNNNLWIYSLDDNTLQRYNYNTKRIEFTSQSLSFNQMAFKAKKLVSSYKNCWLMGEDSIMKFNEYGTYLNEIIVSGIADIELLKEGFIYLKDKNLYKYDNDVSTFVKLEKEISIKSFYINKNEIYIFDGTSIFVFSMN